MTALGIRIQNFLDLNKVHNNNLLSAEKNYNSHENLPVWVTISSIYQKKNTV